MLTLVTGEPLKPNSHNHRWKALLGSAGVRDRRLNDARHTSRRCCWCSGPELTTMGITRWSGPAMAARYQHVTDLILRTAADQVGGLLWADEGTSRDCK